MKTKFIYDQYGRPFKRISKKYLKRLFKDDMLKARYDHVQRAARFNNRPSNGEYNYLLEKTANIIFFRSFFN